MVQARIHMEDKNGLYFITPTVQNWYYIFDRHKRWNILADSLRYLQDNKGLEIHSYVFMLNHIHLIIQAPDIVGLMRDFKRHTTRQLGINIKKTEPNLIELFTSPDGSFKIWKTDNQPKLIETEKFYLQKLNYIHNNPVHKEYVDQPEHWKWSSANPNSVIKTIASW